MFSPANTGMPSIVNLFRFSPRGEAVNHRPYPSRSFEVAKPRKITAISVIDIALYMKWVDGSHSVGTGHQGNIGHESDPNLEIADRFAVQCSNHCTSQSECHGEIAKEDDVLVDLTDQNQYLHSSILVTMTLNKNAQFNIFASSVWTKEMSILKCFQLITEYIYIYIYI